MLDLDASRTGVPPKDAATLLVVRDVAGGLEVFVVERHPKSGFLGGAIVFPGGKVDVEDASDAWGAVVEGDEPGKRDERAVRIAACREALEEAAILPVAGGSVAHADLLMLRARVEKEKSSALVAFLGERRLRLHLGALQPFARWVTPTAESRRFDTRFYVTPLPAGQVGAHDSRETTSSFWARPGDLLSRFDRGEVQLAPPTHRSLEILSAASSSAEAIGAATSACLDPICPLLVPQEGTMALVLPGDVCHPEKAPRAPGRSRFVLRGERWLPEDGPATR